MVDKTVVIDNRSSVSTTIGTELVGMYFLKHQLGGDSPAIHHRPHHRRHARFNKRTGLYNVFPTSFQKTSDQEGMNTYSMGLTSYVSEVVTYDIPKDFTFGQTCTSFSGPFGFPGNPVDDFSDNDKLSVVNKLYSSIVGSEFNMAVFLGQSTQTLDGIALGAARVYHFFGALRKGDLLGAAKALAVPPPLSYLHPLPLPGRGNPPSGGYRLNQKDFSYLKRMGYDLSSSYLDFEYGWRPLLSDVKDAAEMLADRLNMPKRKSYKARKIRRGYVNNSVGFGVSSQAARFFRPVSGYRTYQLTAYISEPPSVAQLTGLTDPASVAWELMPYTFVVDWFIPIGDYLRARSAASTLVGRFCLSECSRFSAGSLTSGRWSGLGLDESYYFVTIAGSDRSKFKNISLTRSVSNTLNGFVPLPKFKPLEAVPSWERAVNAVALLINSRR